MPNFEDADITGIYRFYINNELVAEKTNALTELGRSLIVKNMLGLLPNLVDSISYGISSSPNVLNSASTAILDKSLGFELGRTKVVAGSFEVASANNRLVFQGEIIDPYQYEIREVAIYPPGNVNSTISLDGSVLLDFDFIDDFIKYGTATSASLTQSSSARIGTNALSMPISGNGSTDYIEKITDNQTFSIVNDYSSQDVFKMCLFKTSTTTASMVTRFQSDSLNYYDIVFAVPSASGYHITQALKGAANIVGSPDWSNITSIKMWNPSTSVLNIDALKIDTGSYISDTNFGMISRAVLPQAINKPSSIPLVIEYSLLVNFSGGI